MWWALQDLAKPDSFIWEIHLLRYFIFNDLSSCLKYLRVHNWVRWSCSAHEDRLMLLQAPAYLCGTWHSYNTTRSSNITTSITNDVIPIILVVSLSPSTIIITIITIHLVLESQSKDIPRQDFVLGQLSLITLT